MTNENWKPIAGYEGIYEVSDLGRVRSLNYKHTGKARVLKPGNHRKGYLEVQLCKDGKCKNMKVHRLVAEAFVSNPLNLETVNHIDENKHNNDASNLEWLNRGDNKRYSANKSVQQLDKKTGELLATFPSIIEAARRTEISDSHICACCRGRYKSAGGYIWRYKED